MVRCTLLVVTVLVLGSSVACGLFGGSDDDGPIRMVPDDVLELVGGEMTAAGSGSCVSYGTVGGSVSRHPPAAAAGLVTWI